MKVIAPWLLIFIITFQWMAGQFVLKTVYSVEVAHQMDEREALLAEQLHQTNGLRTAIRILDEDEFNPNSIGYSNQFIFSEEIDGEKVWFTLVTDTVKVVAEQQVSNNTDKDTDHKQALLERLFAKYTVAPLPGLIKEHTLLSAPQQFFIHQQAGLFSPAIPTPPPQLV